jgi:hypothetical protein
MKAARPAHRRRGGRLAGVSYPTPDTRTKDHHRHYAQRADAMQLKLHDAAFT